MNKKTMAWILVIMFCIGPINVLANNTENEVVIEEESTPQAGKKKDDSLPVYFLFTIVMAGAVICFVNQTNRRFTLYIDQILDNGDGSYTVTWKYDKPLLVMRKVITQDSLNLNIKKGTAIMLNCLDYNDISNGKNIEAYKIIVNEDVEIEWNDGVKKQLLDKGLLAKMINNK